MTEKERYSLEQDKNAYKCITDNTNDNLLCTREEIVNRLNQQEKEITEQRIYLNNVLKKYGELQDKLYTKDFFEVESAGEYVEDSRVFKNGLCVYNNRLDMAYSVTEIVEVLNTMTNTIHDYNNEVSPCDNCHHYNPLITPNEGVFEQCLVGRILHRAGCIEYDPIKENMGDKE